MLPAAGLKTLVAAHTEFDGGVVCEIIETVEINCCCISAKRSNRRRFDVFVNFATDPFTLLIAPRIIDIIDSLYMHNVQ